MSAPRLTPLPASGFRRTPWKNGGGVSTDIADCYRPDAAPGSWDGVVWRLGRTQIVTPGPFSDLTGYERLQVVIAGRGLVLVTPQGEIDLREPLVPVRYDGGTPIVTRLENGPVEVVNLIADRALCEIALAVVKPGELAELRPGLHLIYAPDGTAAGDTGGQAVAIEAGDALRIETDQPCRLSLTAGIALLATIIRRDG
ncbi:MAG: HutD family protein [Beijerinckiaceae bacterium]|nr:HutD family protein [Beijerinckiaceae bacterium]